MSNVQVGVRLTQLSQFLPRGQFSQFRHFVFRVSQLFAALFVIYRISTSMKFISRSLPIFALLAVQVSAVVEIAEIDGLSSDDESPKLQEPATVDDSMENQFLVMLKDGVSISSHSKSFLDSFLSKIENATVMRSFEINEMSAYAVQLPSEAAVQDLRQHPDVQVVEPDSMASIASYQSQQNAPWNLARIGSRTSACQKYEYETHAGEGVDVYIIDSGINTAHEEFQGRAKAGASFVKSESGGSSNDLNGHGTHVAGT